MFVVAHGRRVPGREFQFASAIWFFDKSRFANAMWKTEIFLGKSLSVLITRRIQKLRQLRNRRNCDITENKYAWISANCRVIKCFATKALIFHFFFFLFWTWNAPRYRDIIFEERKCHGRGKRKKRASNFSVWFARLPNYVFSHERSVFQLSQLRMYFA